MPAEFAREVIDKCEFATLATVDTEGKPYAVGDTRRAERAFTTGYESACIRGIAEEVISDEEKIEALRLLCERHTPSNMAAFDQAVKASLKRTAVWRVTITEISGKRKVLRSE